MTKSKPKSGAARPARRSLFEADQAKEDRGWFAQHDRRLAARIDALISDTLAHPFTGLGKPEPLKHEWRGWWSRRITGEHRMVYRVSGDTVFVAQYRFHY